MNAVLRPGLGEGFELDIGRLPAVGQRPVIRPDRLHFLKRKEKVRLPRKRFERRVVELAERDMAQRKLVGLALGKLIGVIGFEVYRLHDGIA